LQQGSHIIFDSGDNWNTHGNAEKWDFDQFIIEYSPGQNTTFQFVPQSDGNRTSIDLDGDDNVKGLHNGINDDETLPSDSNYDNKSYYLANLGLTDDNTSTGMQSYLGTKFTNQGQVSTNPANNLSTNLTLRIESSSLFQITAKYSVPTTPSNYLDVGNASTGSVTLDPVGLGLMQNVSIATASDAASAVSSLAKEIEGIGVQMATLGANLSELEIAGERLNNQVYLSEVGISRLTSDVLATESTELAKQQIRLQSSQALMAQAFAISENVLNTLL
jgi:flagellin-like hook-associated protein FlgL